ncbi:hypothetical protein BDZ45DRAFT_330222 [Acephala macrosclerotiorum]|nr:hypothetical protein BDZ45DRAFT_330222 [Acephala macrosclerotiorum]
MHFRLQFPRLYNILLIPCPHIRSDIPSSPSVLSAASKPRQPRRESRNSYTAAHLTLSHQHPHISPSAHTPFHPYRLYDFGEAIRASMMLCDTQLD